MFSFTSRRWFFPTILALAILVEVLVLRSAWPVSIQQSSVQVQSGYELLLQNSPSQNTQPILSYNASARHTHRLTVDIKDARLTDESLRLLSAVHPPAKPARIIYAPEPSAQIVSGPPCLISFKVEFPASPSIENHSVQIAPPKPNDVLNRSTTRLVHLASSSPLLVRISANSQADSNGPSCRNLLSIGTWQQVIGKDLEVGFVSSPESPIQLTLFSPSFTSGADEVESLELEPLLPRRLSIRPLGLTRTLQSREFAGPPALTLTNLRLGGDFFDVDLSGVAGIPISELLGWTQWPILAILDLPLVALSLKPYFLKKTIFLSYSWPDKDRVLPIYARLKQTGLDLWIDREQLRGGDDWEKEIRHKMRTCRRVVIFLSRSMNDGGFFLAELGLARASAENRSKRGAFIIPVRLEDCPVPSILAPWNAVNLFDPDGERRLFESLGVTLPYKS